MGETVNAYRRLPERTSVPDLAWEIDSLIDESKLLRKKLHEIDELLYLKQDEYYSYLREHWTQKEILMANKREEN